jgi:hypothetical protein
MLTELKYQVSSIKTQDKKKGERKTENGDM